jgi:hypothetical protein
MLNDMKDQRTNPHPPQIADTPRSQIVRRLQDAIDELQTDVARVEMWASALATFSQPIPDYSQSKWREFDRASGTGRSAAADRPAKPAESD